MKSKIFLSIFFILLCCINCILFSKKYPEDTKDTEYTLFIQSLRSCEENKVSYYVYMKDTHDKFILNIYSSEYANNKVDLNKYTNLNYGEVIKVKGKIKVPQKLNNPGEFNYKLYLYSNNIYGQINTYQEINVEEYKKNIIESIYSKIYSFKKHITTSIEKSMNKEHASIAKALIYGENTELEEGVKEDFKSLGISHLTSVSGSHITAFMCIINIILNGEQM